MTPINLNDMPLVTRAPDGKPLFASILFTQEDDDRISVKLVMSHTQAELNAGDKEPAPICYSLASNCFGMVMEELADDAPEDRAEKEQFLQGVSIEVEDTPVVH